jgi:hypothetical protein
MGGGYAGAYAGTNAFASIKRPTTAGEWASVADGVLAPDYLYNCQESASPLIEAIAGASSLVKGGAGTAVYQQSVTDWTSYWVGTPSSGVVGWSTGAGNLYTGNNTSVFALVIYRRPSSASAVQLYCHSQSAGTLGPLTSVNSTGKMFARNGANTATGTFDYEDTTPHVAVYFFDRSRSLNKVYTDQELVTVTWNGSVTDASKGIGNNVTGTAPGTCLFNQVAIWKGINAETMVGRNTLGYGSTAGGKTLIAELGWTLGY